VHDGHRWKQFTSFAEDSPRSDQAAAPATAPARDPGQAAPPEVIRVLREWHRPLILGEPDAVAHACELFA